MHCEQLFHKSILVLINCFSLVVPVIKNQTDNYVLDHIYSNKAYSKHQASLTVHLCYAHK